MPELPEVETVRAGLAEFITGGTITDVEIFDARSLKRHRPGPNDFVATLVGSKITSVVRRGKFLWMPLNASPLALVGHLGMSGQMLVRTPDFEPDKLTRVILHFTAVGGKKYQMRFVDQRIFGSLALDELISTADETGESIPTTAAHIARDPLDPYFDVSSVIAKLRKRTAGIKKILLDQQLMSGVGNIYADEALWRAKLHYDQPANSLSLSKTKELINHVTEILAAAVKVGGTSFDEQYKNVNGESGYFEISLNAYGMTGRPCNRCGKPIRRDSWMNRGSHFCPNCQKLRKP
jgi:formamidopyrimidine-DNA glycosylase